MAIINLNNQLQPWDEPYKAPDRGFNGPNVNDPYGLANEGEFMPYGIGSLTLGQPQGVPNQFSGDFNENYFDLMNRLAGQTQQQWQYKTPLADAAQIGLSGIPQPTAQQFGQSPDLAFLLSGKGFDDATLARMNASAQDAINRAGIAQLSQARRAGEQSGLAGSPAGFGIEADVARQTGERNIDALNQIAIQNAMTGNQNRLTGVGFQTQIGLSNMQQANMMALENANRMFSAMSQNAGFQQQANLSNAGAQQRQMENQAGEVGKVLGNFGSNWANSATNMFNNANQFNANQDFNWKMANAQLERDRQARNQGALEDRNRQAVGLFGANYGVS